MKKILFIILFLIISSSSFAITQWCDHANIGSCLNMEEGTGATTYDQSSLSNNGAIAVATWSETVPTLATDSFAGTSNYSIVFDPNGGSDAVTISYDAEDLAFPSGTNEISIVSWANYSGEIGNTILCEGSEIILRIEGGKSQLILNSFSSNDRATSSGSYTIDTWEHFAGTFDGTTLTAYLNGVGTSVTPTGSWGGLTSNYVIGNGNAYGGNGGFDGYIDELAIFKVGLDSTDINDIMENGLVQVSGAPPQIF